MVYEPEELTELKQAIDKVLRTADKIENSNDRKYYQGELLTLLFWKSQEIVNNIIYYECKEEGK